MIVRNVLSTAFVSSLFLGFVCCQAEKQFQLKLACIEHEECGRCLSAASHCRWCAGHNFNSTVPRCNDDQSLVEAGCSQGLIQRPEMPVWEVVEDQPLQDVPPDSLDTRHVTQIRPQRVRVSIKPRETKKITFTYRPAKNYPLDLYYLMDLTWSMKDDKETLVSLRDDLPNMLKNLTDNFRIGFGSFAEKPLMPFISTAPQRKANPCAMEGQQCNATYSYRHHLSLTNEVSIFIENVNISSVTANMDNAEAQLDALVQVLTCGDKIGWSTISRKIVILLTDGLMHTAGDGVLGGATRKNDESCHLDDNGFYSEAHILDYPSISQVHRLLEKYKVNVIFGVTDSVKPHYDQLHQLLSDSTYIGKLESDSSNILKLVKTGYQDIVSVVDFEDDSSLGPVKVKYFTDCGIKGGSMVEAVRCTGVEFGMTLNYEAHITLDACLEWAKSTQTIKISESQLGQDSLTLEVDIQCGCSCQVEPEKDNFCGLNQHRVCGVCLCDKGWSGPNCDCSLQNEQNSADLEAQCHAPNATRSLACSGVGDCVCGSCNCDRGYTGKYCQCKTCEVSRENRIECGGVGRGSCVCGECVCADGWSGPTCDCTDSTETCVAPGKDEVCSGHGSCKCGKCQCFSDSTEKYLGHFCETCPTCDNSMCVTVESCVHCYLNSTCSDYCNVGLFNYTVSERYDKQGDKDASSVACVLRITKENEECEYKYTYSTATRALVAMEIVITEKNCYQPTTTASIMSSGLIIMFCILLAGIIVILFIKCAQIFADRRAYAKFMEEVEMSKMQGSIDDQMNPLYISPITNYELPEEYRDLQGLKRRNV